MAERWIREWFNAPYRAHADYHGGKGIVDGEGRVAKFRSRMRRRRFRDSKQGDYAGATFEAHPKRYMPHGSGALPQAAGAPPPPPEPPE